MRHIHWAGGPSEQEQYSDSEPSFYWQLEPDNRSIIFLRHSNSKTNSYVTSKQNRHSITRFATQRGWLDCVESHVLLIKRNREVTLQSLLEMKYSWIYWSCFWADCLHRTTYVLEPVFLLIVCWWGADLLAGWMSPSQWGSNRWSLPCADEERLLPHDGSAPLAQDTPWLEYTWLPVGTPVETRL